MKSCTQTAHNTTKRVPSAPPVENSPTFFHSSIVLIVFPRQSGVHCFGRSLFRRNTHHSSRSYSHAETQVTICVDGKNKFTPLQFWKLICWRLQFPPPMFCFVFSNGLLKTESWGLSAGGGGCISNSIISYQARLHFNADWRQIHSLWASELRTRYKTRLFSPSAACFLLWPPERKWKK